MLVRSVDPMYVLSLEAAVFLLVPPAPLSIMNKSASTIPSPISVPPSISNAAKGNPPAVCTKVLILDKAAFLLVPPAPSSTIIKSEVVKSAPISVPPSIS